VLLGHAQVGVAQYGAGEVGSAPSVYCRGRSCSFALKELSAAKEVKIGALVKKAVRMAPL
jgi:hypothetical protein